ncbi:hypothetical protein [Microbulbifer sp. THAF38]|uniref:hypothetical protein n=1 Tax=Microbulbifer sp. THAF38 TaxID=2587856 RepID=UPI001268894A|nr:hypothetical protein [Microbulbifer sp. THAF38]QFT53799.1 hypothetical protein FIU95_04320 [Microbulbifer sp. THAF38]
MVERKTFFAVIVRFTSKRSYLLDEAVISHMMSFKEELNTNTFNNGLGFFGHERIVKGLYTDIYFAPISILGKREQRKH